MILEPPLAAYPYVQYNDDDNINAFFIAYNEKAQEYVDFFNEYNLADYNSILIGGELLDWIADGIYGMRRPFLVSGSAAATIGPLGTVAIGTGYLGEFAYSTGVIPTYSFVPDDIFKKVMTWNFFKGDGTVFNINWLKRRVIRFLNDTTYPDETYDVSVQFTSSSEVTIEVATSTNAEYMQSLVRSNILELPPQFAFTVSLI